MENTNQNFIDSITPIVRQINLLAIKLQHVSKEERFKGTTIDLLSDSMKHYIDQLSYVTGIELESKPVIDMTPEQKEKLTHYPQHIQEMILFSPSLITRNSFEGECSEQDLRKSVKKYTDFWESEGISYTEKIEGSQIKIEADLKDASFELRELVFGGGLTKKLMFS